MTRRKVRSRMGENGSRVRSPQPPTLHFGAPSRARPYLFQNGGIGAHACVATPYQAVIPLRSVATPVLRSRATAEGGEDGQSAATEDGGHALVILSFCQKTSAKSADLAPNQTKKSGGERMQKQEDGCAAAQPYQVRLAGTLAPPPHQPSLPAIANHCQPSRESKYQASSLQKPSNHWANVQKCSVGAVPRQICWKTLCLRPQAGRYIFSLRVPAAQNVASCCHPVAGNVATFSTSCIN